MPNYLGHADNYIPANPLVTPAHIVPEWYFLPFYAILRAIPDKLRRRHRDVRLDRVLAVPALASRTDRTTPARCSSVRAVRPIISRRSIRTSRPHARPITAHCRSIFR
jgi:hypothetical protein